MARTDNGGYTLPDQSLGNVVSQLQQSMLDIAGTTARWLALDVAGSGDYTLGTSGEDGDQRALALKLTGALSGARNLRLPMTGGAASRIIWNKTTGGATLTVRTTHATPGNTVTVAQDKARFVFHDGGPNVYAGPEFDPLAGATTPGDATGTLRTGLVADWELDETSGTRNDSKGASHLADNNTVTSTTGKVGTNAALFTSANSESLSSADNAALSLSAGRGQTFAFWVKPTTWDSAFNLYGLMYKGSTGEYGVSKMNNSTAVRFRVYCGGAPFDVVSATGLVAAGSWHLVIAWYDPATNTINLRINNGTPYSTAVAGAVADGSGTFYLGYNPENGHYYDGAIDAARIWQRVLTSAEQAELWNNGAGVALDAESGELTAGSDFVDTTAYQVTSEKNQPNGYAGLNAGGLLNSAQLPPLSITDTYVVSSQAAMLALTAEVGDVAVRTDLNKTFILKTAGASTLSHWQELLTPTDVVQSVFGRTGTVTAQANDYTWAQVDKTVSSLADLATRSASDLSSGTLPDARFPPTLPAVSGANLTSLNASNLSSGTVPSARLSLSASDVPTLTASKISDFNAQVDARIAAASASAVISGAGSASVNGTLPVSGSANGKNRYFDGGTENMILWTGSAWWVIDGGSGSVLYTSSDNTTYPWEVTTWVATGAGTAPVPTVSHT